MATSPPESEDSDAKKEAEETGVKEKEKAGGDSDAEKKEKSVDSSAPHNDSHSEQRRPLMEEGVDQPGVLGDDDDDDDGGFEVTDSEIRASTGELDI